MQLPHKNLKSKEWLRTYAFLSSLIMIIVIYPFLTDRLAGKIIASLLILLTLGGGVATMFSHRYAFWITLTIVGGAVVVEILPYILPGVFFHNLTYLRSFAVNAFFAILLFYYLLRVEHLSPVEIGNAVSIYLLVGLAFANLYTYIEATVPEAFAIGGVPVNISPVDLIYFSFTTLTTTGFGDIAPACKITRVLANLEAIFGVFYIAIIIGRMVGGGFKKDPAPR